MYAAEITNEMLFYGGLIIVAFSCFAGLLYFGISQIRKVKLEQKLDEAYGKKEKRKQ